MCDDIIPVVQAERISESQGHWWVILLEKGYAKFAGSYENINGGFPRYSLYHLTGGVCVDIELNYKNERKIRNMFDLLLQLVRTKLVVINAGNMARLGNFKYPVQYSVNLAHY